MTLSEFKSSISDYTGFFVVENQRYDSIYFGLDNIYVSFAFNYITGKATNEALFLVTEVKKLSDTSYLLIYEDSESVLSLEE